MAWTDWILPAAGIAVGGITSLVSANKAADAQTRAANQSTEYQKYMYDTSRGDLAPFRDVGQNALYQLASATGVEYAGAPGTIQDRMATALNRFQASPDYNFRLNEGVKALDQSAASRGKLYSGGQQKAITEYGQNLASGEWNNYLNRIAAQAGIGQTATNAQVASNANTAANVGNTLQYAGDARASGYAGMANAVNNSVNNALYLYGRA